MSGEPQDKEEKHAEGPDHLHFFHLREHRSEGGSQGSAGQTPAQQLQEARQEPTEDEEKPQAERNLGGGQKGKSDERRIDEILQLDEAGKQPLPGHVGTQQQHVGDFRYLREISVQAVEGMKQQRDGRVPS